MKTIDSNFIKQGSCALVLGVNHYKDYIPEKDGYLLKVTNIIPEHSEFNHLDTIKKIKSYQKFYSIPENEIYQISTKNPFHQQFKI